MSDTRHLFSQQADAYRAGRPTYDPAFFAWLAQAAPGTAQAWDCGCGSGQASLDLARNFQRVVATDINAKQLEQAPREANIDYRLEPAESTSLATASVDLTLVAQALHWFDVERFYAEVRRVSRPGALLAVVSYNLLNIDERLDALIRHLYHDVVGPYWAPERKHVETGYETLPFPFERVATPPFALEAQWSFQRLVDYLYSWSAVASYRQATGQDPVQALHDELRAAWGDAPERAIAWPLTIKLGRVA
ncbi:class I SAM-dependent methyltransferase [Pseudomonas citronellolis]|uniref:class I SAM-dependent methyltransferase n=1 Tax=Pseudomonas citronellolis TaxID=53408 RepID=UPI0023E407AB|nr:class I SAM-dependent methyltransferase [Pseudomonas citronellolis]MDF3936970.1 class I SAM-dependent methyltransferase [Pseudomonas citronellolis]